MNEFFTNYKSLLDIKMDMELMKDKKTKPIARVLKKYGIEGMRAIEFIAEIATACEQSMQDKSE